MTDAEKIMNNLIKAGHEPQLVKQVKETATSLRAILDEIPAPQADDLKQVFQDNADHD